MTNDVTLQIIYNFVIDCLLVDKLYILFRTAQDSSLPFHQEEGKKIQGERLSHLPKRPFSDKLYSYASYVLILPPFASSVRTEISKKIEQNLFIFYVIVISKYMFRSFAFCF